MSREENFLFKDHNEPLLAEEVGPNLYRLLECPVFTEEVHYGDMVEVEPQADGSLSFRGVAEPTRYRSRVGGPPRNWASSAPNAIIDVVTTSSTGSG